MVTSKNTGRVIFAVLIAAALYTAWTAMGSSVCAKVGVDNQTRTTFAPFDGCKVIDDFRSPDWMFHKRVENR